MFVPHEAALAEAFRVNPDLLEEALKSRVIPATPIVFFALLKTIAYGWMQHKAIENAENIVKEVAELYKRIQTCLSHASKFAKSLKDTVERYNEFVGSLEYRVMPCVRRLANTVGNSKELPQLETIDASPLPILTEANEDSLWKEGQ